MEYNEVDTFANTLKKHDTKKSLNLYYENIKGKKKLHNDRNQHCEVKDVISNISKQMRAIQSADNVNKVLNKRSTIHNFKTNNFLPVNMIPALPCMAFKTEYRETENEEKSHEQSEPNNFETQCELDTQLINFIEGAEALMDIPKNLDQEFYTFKNIDNNTKNVSETINKRPNEIAAENLQVQETKNYHLTNTEQYKHINLSYNNKKGKNSRTIVTKHEGLKTIDLYKADSEIMNAVKSPVLKQNTSEPKTSLTYTLESFERFENLALPLINDNLDFKAAKKVINLQILNKELFIQTHTEQVLSDRDKTPSPILGKRTKFEGDSKKVTNLIEIDTKKVNAIEIEDEILFSDEEFDDLPLTCALATSFYKQKDVLDKTMFVGFQTASDKSIQVHKESYSKAKSILDDNITFTKLVEVIDSSKYKNDNDLKENNETNDLKENNETNDPMSGFQTAHGNKIDISRESLMKGKRVFQGILDCVNTHSKYNEFENLNDKNLNLLKNLPKPGVTKCNNIVTIKKINENKISQEYIKNPHRNTEIENIDACIMEEFENNFLSDDNISKIDDKRNISEKPKDKDVFSFGGFKTANNNIIKISEQALAKTRNMFEDIDFSDITEPRNEKKENCQNFDNYNANQPSTSNFMGFKTSNNKVIKVSEQALVKNRNIFDNIDEGTLPNKHTNDKPINSEGEIRTFTINENPTKVNTISKPETSYKNYDENYKSPNTNTNLSQVLKIANNNLNKIFRGFKTANKTVGISKAGLAKSEHIFKDILSCKEINKLYKYWEDESNATINKTTDLGYKQNPINLIKESEYENRIQNIGFKTASNKTVKISEKALEKSKKIFQDITLSQFEEDAPKKCDKQQDFQGFKTASNKSVSISNEALAKSKNLLKDMQYTGANYFTAGDGNNDEYKVRNCLRTAHNKLIKTREEALVTSEKVFHDLQNENTYGPLKDSNIFEGFKTANNKRVKISKQALAKTKNIFQNLDVDIFDNENDNNNLFVGFQTANNKEVKISKEALLKSRQIFENMDLNENKTSDKAKTKAINDQEVNVSKDSIERTKLISNNIRNRKDCPKNDDVLIMDDLINTEVIKDLEESLDTNDFNEKTPISKRSGSPILSCPNSKRRKFKTPQFITKINTISDTEKVKINSIIKFCDNYKKNKIYTLRDIKKVDTKINNDPTILHYNFDNLLEFEFRGKRNDIDTDVWTTERIKQYFTDAVNKKIIPNGWIENHLKLIIWKLLSYEIFFPESMKDVCSVQNVLNQLKYRYDRELYNVERPVLRKILEKDEVASKIMVLCVVNFYVNGVSVSRVANKTQNIEILVTDGWYCIKACADRMIDQLICDGKIRVGTKLAIHGAELMNCDQGIAPWEDTSLVRLKVSGNSTRRCKWYTRLGYHGNAAILSSLSRVRVDGGKTSHLRGYVAKVYPMLFVEKFDDGSTVTRSERLENIHQMKYETDRQNHMEKLYDEVEKMSEQESQDSEPFDDRNLDTGSQIYRAMKKSKDGTDFRINLTDTQAKLLQEHTHKKRDQFIENLQRNVQELVKKRGLDMTRNVVPLLKIRLADVYNECVEKSLITIWRPTEYLLDVIQEGSWIDVYNVMPTAVRYGELQISAGRQSIFKKSKINQNHTKTIVDKLKRQCYHIRELKTIDNNEIDTVGLVFMIEQTNNQFQNVYLADENKNMICINFWGGINNFGFENILNIGEIVSCVNLYKRTGNTDMLQYRVTEFSYFTKTSKIDVIRKYTEEFTAKFVKIDKIQFINGCVAIKNNFDNLKSGNNITPYRLNNSDYNITKNRIFINSPLNNLDINLNLTDLDFESTYKQTDTQSLSQNSKRKKKVDEKIAKLKKYGEPPPLNLIHIKNSSIKPYKSPLINNDITNVVSLKILPESKENTSKTPNNPNMLPKNKINSSPLLNRTCVKSINPVKLNFSKDFDEADPFAEEFDYSPPLSLE